MVGLDARADEEARKRDDGKTKPTGEVLVGEGVGVIIFR